MFSVEADQSPERKQYGREHARDTPNAPPQYVRSLVKMVVSTERMYAITHRYASETWQDDPDKRRPCPNSNYVLKSIYPRFSFVKPAVSWEKRRGRKDVGALLERLLIS